MTDDSEARIRVLARKIQDHGTGIRVAEATLETTDGEVFRRRYLHTPDAVAIVAVQDGQLILVREYRAAVDQKVLQVPMGKVDGGRTPLMCAHAELAEETGYRAARWELAGTLLSCPGWMDQTLHVYRAAELSPVAERSDSTDPDDVEEAQLTVETLPVDGVAAAVAAGQLRDARTIAAVYLALH